MGLRVAGLLCVLFAAARADDHAALRAVLAKEWGKKVGERVEITLPSVEPRVPEGAGLFLESSRGGSFGHSSTLIRFEPRANGTVFVRRIQDRFNPAASTPVEFGATITAAEMERAQYDALLRDLLLIRDAKFRWRENAPKFSARYRGSKLFYTRTRVFLAGELVGPELHSESATEWDAARVWMYVDRVKRALDGCTFESAPLEPREGAVLLEELIAERAKKSRWGSAVTVRIRVLGAVGYAPAADELRTIPKRGRIGYRAAQTSLRQIEVLHAPDPKAALLGLLQEPSHPAFPWARAMLRSLYRGDYKRFQVARVGRGDPAALAVVRDLAEDPEELEARGLTMSDAGKRASAEAAEWELTKSSRSMAVLLKLVRDKDLPDRPRTETIRLLQRIAPGETGVRDALLMMVVDTTDARAVRDEAARTLRHYGGARTIELLSRVQERSPSASVAETLRILGSN